MPGERSQRNKTQGSDFQHWGRPPKSGARHQNSGMKAAISNLDVKNTAGQKMIARHAPEHKLDETINLFSRGDLKSATRKASALRKKYPNCFNSANVFAACMMTANRLPEAANAYERTISLEPSYAVGHFNIGVCNQDTNRFDKAIDSYTRALEIDPNYFDAAFNRGGVLKMLGNYSEALTDLCYAHTSEVGSQVEEITLYRTEIV